MSAYYNEHDPKAAAWLRELIAAGLIAPGDVDERSILEVRPHELTHYTQQHFFAGIGGWSYALRLAGWPDARPVRTGSCPCQPFSVAGKGLAEKDARHLWPAFRDLITFGEPTVTFGEQVASAAGREWLAGVRADLEALGYEVGGADLCAAGAGAPHIRQRLYWMAHASGARRNGAQRHTEGEARHEARMQLPRAHREARGLAVSECAEWRPLPERRNVIDGYHAGREEAASGDRADSETRRLGDAGCECDESRGRVGDMGCTPEAEQGEARERQRSGHAATDSVADGAWSRFDVLPFRDGKCRRVEPGTFPLAHGVPGRVGLLRGYGNAIVPQQAAEFIRACVEAIG